MPSMKCLVQLPTSACPYHVIEEDCTHMACVYLCFGNEVIGLLIQVTIYRLIRLIE